MNLKALRLASALLLPVAMAIGSARSLDAAESGQPQLEQVAAFPTQQVTGVAVSKEGRVFVNFPFWSDEHSVSVAEVMKDGSLKPFPDENWNRNEGDPGKRWVCVQSVFVDDQNALWVLDPAAPKMEAIVKGGPKLVKVNLTSNAVERVIPFEEAYAPERSYLNDVRIDNRDGFAFISESGLGSLVVVNLKDGSKRRVLANHPSTKAETIDLVVDGIRLVDPKTGTTPAIQTDGIALDRKDGVLFFRSLTGRTVYKIPTEALKDWKLSDEELGSRVSKAAETPATDGMLWDGKQHVYCAAFEKNAIVRFDVPTGKTESVIEDERLQWPDTLSWGPDGSLYVTTSQIHRTPRFNEGQNKQKGPFAVYRVKPGEGGH